MPKRRMSSRRRAQIKAWQLAGAKARAASSVTKYHGSYSSPHLGAEKLGWSPRKQRTIKYMGKAAHKHSSGSSVTIAPWARQALAGETITHSRNTFDPKHFEGNPQMTQAKGVPYRRKAAPKPKTSAPVNPQTAHGMKQNAMADKAGMSVTELKKKMAADSRKLTAELKKQNGLKINPYKKKHGPGKGH